MCKREANSHKEVCSLKLVAFWYTNENYSYMNIILLMHNRSKNVRDEKLQMLNQDNPYLEI